jgi:hypothetical protein
MDVPPAKLTSAMSSLCGSASPRPAPVPAPCSPRPALVPAPPARCSPSARAGEDEGTEKTTSVDFWRDFSPRAHAQLDSRGVSSRRRLPDLRREAVEFAWEHERSPSSHNATALLSLLIYCSERRGFFAKL